MEKRKDTRTLHIKNELWQYKIGKRCVAIYNPEGKRFFPTIIEIVGKNNVENENFYLNPATIVNYITDTILGEGETHKICCHCNVANNTVRLRPNPFEAEIYEDYTPHYFCNKCVEEIEWEI